MKLTKIIATIGPASESEEKIEELIENGVNIFRFNFKHNDVDWHGRVIDRVRKVARRKKTMIGILMDLQGPEIRTLLPGESLEMNPGDLFELSDGKSDAAIAVTHPSVIGYLEVGFLR